jgi:hypothetical protein
MDLFLETKLNITDQSDPYLNYFDFNHVITIEKTINKTNEMIKDILQNYTYSFKRIKSYYTYKISQLKIHRSNVLLNIHKLSDNETVVGFNIITSNNRIPSYRLMYSIIKKIEPNTIIPRILRKSSRITNEILPISDIYIQMIKSLSIEQIEIGIKGIASLGCNDDKYYQLTPYLSYIDEIMNICDCLKKPKSTYECDIFTISSNICARILVQSYKKGILDKVKYKETINKLHLLINNIQYKDSEQKRIFDESLELLCIFT